MDTGEDGIDVLRKLLQRKVIIENCKPPVSMKSLCVRQFFTVFHHRSMSLCCFVLNIPFCFYLYVDVQVVNFAFYLLYPELLCSFSNF